MAVFGQEVGKMGWQEIIGGIAGGIAGNPNIGFELAMRKMKIQMMQEKLKQEAEGHAIEQQYRFYSYGDAMLII